MKRSRKLQENGWYKKNDPSKDCDWVGEFPLARCGHSTGTYGVRGWNDEFAMQTCSACVMETQVGAFMCEESDGYDIVMSDFHPDFPPKELIDVGYVRGEGFGRDPELYDDIAEWFNTEFAAVEYEPQDLSEREKMMVGWSAVEYVEAFKAGNVTSTEYTTLMVSRMNHYRMLNAWFVTSYELSDQIIDQAEAIDEKAATEGIESVAPLYGLPVPAKGTMASVDFPGGAGVGVLDGCYSAADAALITLLKEANGVVMGKTNVPEFACSWQSANHLNGVVRSAYNTTFTVCGSSGGSASAVAAYIAPIAITEDTGGSTRCPAHANGNFGYDPARNKYPNDGNPGLTRYQDQLGTNARSFDDILLFDKAILNISAEHEAAELAVADAEVKIGFPEETFVNLNIPTAVRDLGLTTTPDRRADESMRDALEMAKSMLSSEENFEVVEDDWPTMESSTLNGETMSMLYHMIYGIEYAPGELFSRSICGETFSGQVSQWLQNFVRAFDTTVLDVIDDTRPIGASHGPGGCLIGDGLGSETHLRFCSVWQTLAPEYWNAYFDEYDLDMIITPTQFTSTQLYAENAEANGPIEILQEDGSYEIEYISGTSLSGAYHYTTFKMLHISKVTVPIGLDAEGRPISFTIWGRAMPAEEMFCDECSVTFDTEFLYKVKKVIDVLHAEGSELMRVDSTLAMGDVLAA